MPEDSKDSIEIIYHIRRETEHGNYNDSLYFPYADYIGLSKEKITEMAAPLAQKRVDNWIAVITTPVEPRIPTEEELIQAKNYVLEQLSQVDAQKDELYPPKPVSELTKEELAELKAKYQAELEAAQAKVDNINAITITVGMVEEVVK